MQFDTKLLILIISLFSLRMISFDSKTETRLAQNGNNAIGQDGDENNASQSAENSQSTDQNSICASGDSTSLSCNNLSSESIGDASFPGKQGPPGAEGPQGEQGPAGTVDVYRVDGPTVTNEQGDSQVSSTDSCSPGDSVTGGGVNTNLVNGNIRQLTSTPNNSLDAWTAIVTSSSGSAGDTTITAFAVCQDNTP
jgi:hypothetical protein